jgi:mannosyl-3-phosphoglycerate synthase
MRLTFPFQTERVGAVRIYGMQHVFELDCGHLPAHGESGPAWGTTVAQVVCRDLRSIHERMAIVVPCKDERLKVLEGVLRGIPHDCLVILVSNSGREPVDRFAMERESVERFCRFNQRSALVVHQRDPGLARAFEKAGMPSLVGTDGVVRNGKGEGMLVATALARLAGRDFVGYVDADNYVPGSVREYIDCYAADLFLANTRFAMVRISWHSKPKPVDGVIFFNRWGRTSESTNRFLNLLMAHLTGFGTEAIRTGNAGEHAMTMELAERISFASGFAVEPYQLIDILERYGGIELPETTEIDGEVMHEGVEIYQVATLNPHFHEDKGDDHVEGMTRAALSTIFHSPATPGQVEEAILSYVNTHLEDGTALEPVVSYPPLSSLDWEVLEEVLARDAATLERIDKPGLSRRGAIT